MGWRGSQPSPAVSEQAGNQLQYTELALPPVIQKKRIGVRSPERSQVCVKHNIAIFWGTDIWKPPLSVWGYERNPPKPRYSQFWDVDIVFALLKKWGLNSALALKLLSFKLVMLLLLVSSQRGQTIVNLSVDGMEVDENVVFKMKVLLKHNRVGDPLDTLVLRPFQECKRLYVVRTLKRYLDVTETIRGHSHL